ncbi:MAG: hypothetical protein KC620_09555 [Myxococcales bacterium]|nr:hypothetical protein [Myxococcales bacterium]
MKVLRQGVAVVLGSAFAEPRLGGYDLPAVTTDTIFGPATLHRWPERRNAFVLFRHGTPHRHLPHQINWRAQAAALAIANVGSVLLTSSVGVMDPMVPLFRPLRVYDLFMPDNRLPDGTACTLWPEPADFQGHLVLDGGLFDAELGAQIDGIARGIGHGIAGEVLFAYVGGPRTKTAAENAWYARQGAQVNSMSIGPEAVLLNEAELSVAAVVVGHKASRRDARQDLDRQTLAESLTRSHAALEALVVAFLREGRPVPFKNRIYRFDEVP